MGESKIVCDRAAGTVHADLRLSHADVRLADVSQFALGEGKASLGRGARVETTHGIIARTGAGETKLTEFTADTATIERFRDGIAKLEAFRTGADPTLTLTIEVEQSRAMRANYAGTVVLLAICLIVGVALYFMFRR